MHQQKLNFIKFKYFIKSLKYKIRLHRIHLIITGNFVQASIYFFRLNLILFFLFQVITVYFVYSFCCMSYLQFTFKVSVSFNPLFRKLGAQSIKTYKKVYTILFRSTYLKCFFFLKQFFKCFVYIKLSCEKRSLQN